MNDHPDDIAARIQLRDTIRQARIDAGLNQYTYARRLGVVQSAVPLFEKSTSHLVGTAQRYARAADHRLVIHVHDLPPTVSGAAMSLRQLAAGVADPETADAYHRAAVLETLRAERIRSGQTTRAVASAMGCGRQAVLSFEVGYDDIRLATLQRYTRALGGRLDLHLQPVERLTEKVT